MPRTGDGRPIGPPATDVDVPRPAPIKSAGAAAVVTALMSNYAVVQYHYVQFLADHLTDCRKTLGGDFDDLMMLAILGQRFIGARIDRDAGVEGAEARVWMSAMRLSDVTGVPRESVRRKLFRLKSKGWVTHDPAQGWRITGSLDGTQARFDLNSLDARGIERLARLVAAIIPLVSVIGTTTEDDDPPV